MSTRRIDELVQLRDRIDREIESERLALARRRSLLTAVNVATTRGSWNTRVFNAACLHFSADSDRVIDGKRDRCSMDARHVAMWLMRDAGRVFTEIAGEFSCDHTSVMNAVRRVEREPTLLAAATEIRAFLTGEAA